MPGEFLDFSAILVAIRCLELHRNHQLWCNHTYQLGHIDAVWDPFFAGAIPGDGKNATEEIITSSVSEAWPVPDAGIVLNRVAHPTYPDTVCGVVFQGSERSTGCQFTFTCDGSLARKPAQLWWDRAAKVARAALGGAVYAPVGLATHYHTVQIHPYWADSLHHVGTIGAHRFYRWQGAAGRSLAFSNVYRGGEPVPAPTLRLASADVAGADPLTLARAYEAATPAVVQHALDDAAGGEARFGGSDTVAVTGQVREEYARSGQWLRQPTS